MIDKLKKEAKRKARENHGVGTSEAKTDRGLVRCTATLGLRNIFTYEFTLDGELICYKKLGVKK